MSNVTKGHRLTATAENKDIWEVIILNERRGGEQYIGRVQIADGKFCPMTYDNEPIENRFMEEQEAVDRILAFNKQKAKIGAAAGSVTLGPAGAIGGALLGAILGHRAEKADPGPVWEWSPRFGVRPLTPDAFRCSRKT